MKQCVDTLLMQKYNVNDIKYVVRDGYRLLTGERKTRSAAGKRKFPEAFN